MTPECSACDGAPGQAYHHIVGGMCFACGLSTGGTVATERHRAEARRKMIAALAKLLREATPDQADLAALLARCPPDVAERARAALAEKSGGS